MNHTNRVLLGVIVALAGCANDLAFREGRAMLAEGRTEEGLARLEEAVQEAPGKPEYRSYLVKQRERALNLLLAQAMTQRLNGQYDAAEATYARAQRLDPNNPQVQAGAEALALARQHDEAVASAQKLLAEGQADKAQPLLRRVLAENPRHREAKAALRKIEERQASRDATATPRLTSLLAKPITLEFRDAGLKAVFEVISRSAGINFVFDKDVRPDLKATIFVKDTSIEDAVHLLLLTNQLDRKLVGDNTVLVYPNTPAKQKDYQDLVMKTFYLANADVKQAGTLIKTMLKTRDVFVDERTNSLVIRDTPEAVRMAEKLIAAQDLAEPEAVLEVEVLEVSKGRLETLGVQWPTQIGYGLLQGGTTTTNIVADPNSTTSTTTVSTSPATVANGVINLRNRPLGLTTFIANPALLLNIKAQDTLTNVLANPRIRVKNREKAKIHIGDKVPVITSTATSTGFVSQSITYLDVGVKLDVEPNIGIEDEVTMKVGLEVSNIARQITTSSGTIAFQVGTRSAGTTLRLKDGETQVLAGLIQEDDRRTASKIPGLGDLPALGRLFSSHDDNISKTEIVLLITPHIVRNMAFPAASSIEFKSGTDSGAARMSLGGEGAPALAAPVALPGAMPAAAPQPAPAPALVEPAPGAPAPVR